MKKFNFISTVLVLSVSILIGDINAQFTSIELTASSVVSGSPRNKARADQRAFFAITKAQKSFDKEFAVKAKVLWHGPSNLHLAYFKDKDIVTRVAYRKNGTWFRTVKVYRSEQLDKKILKYLHRIYSKFDIGYVSEVFEDGLHCYFISMQQGNKFQEVVYYNGESFVNRKMTLIP